MLPQAIRVFFERRPDPNVELTTQQIQEMRADPLSNLEYFAEWGASVWLDMLRQIVTKDLGTEWFQGKRVLEIGSRFGRISTLFALLGAEVTGIDVVDEHRVAAEKEAARFGVQERAQFLTADATEHCLAHANAFDLVFSKSVLVLFPDLDKFLAAAHGSLRSEGIFTAIENGRGGFLLRTLRHLRPKGYNHSHIQYFDQSRLDLVKAEFPNVELTSTDFPPVHKMVAKRS